MDRQLEIINTTQNNTKVTITPSRVTLKIAEKHLDRFSKDVWDLILEKFSNIQVLHSRRGMLNFLPTGFHVVLKTENDKHKIVATFFEELKDMIHIKEQENNNV